MRCSIDPPINLLLVDDVGEDADMFAYVLETLEQKTVHLRHEKSIHGACAYITGHEIDTLPDTIIIDSFLRGPSRGKLLDCIHCIPQLASVPIVVLSGAQLPAPNTANPRIQVHYVKPVRIAELRAIAREIVATAESYATGRLNSTR